MTTHPHMSPKRKPLTVVCESERWRSTPVYRSESPKFAAAPFDRPMKNKGLGERFGRNLRSFWVTRRSLGDRGGPWSGSCEVDVAAVGRDRRDRGRFLRADDPRRGCRRRQLALGCARARADDVSKSRRQELVVCRATCVLLVSDLSMRAPVSRSRPLFWLVHRRVGLGPVASRRSRLGGRARARLRA